MTKTIITKIAKENGIALELIKIYRTNGTYGFEMANLPSDTVKANIEYYNRNGEQLPEVEKMIRKYNREVKKLLKALGEKYWGFRCGDGTWQYELGEQSYSTKLAFANID